MEPETTEMIYDMVDDIMNNDEEFTALYKNATQLTINEYSDSYNTIYQGILDYCCYSQNVLVRELRCYKCQKVCNPVELKPIQNRLMCCSLS